MADREIYRVEIPIIVDDQTDAPLKQAERKISKFEKSVQKTNERVRRLFGREIRLRIGAIDKVWPVIRSIQTHLRGLTGKTWNIIIQAKDRATNTIKSILNKLTSPLALLGAGAGLGAGIFFPLKLAGEMEQAGIAMEFFTESAEKGQKFLEELQTFAAKTPFEFPDVRDAAVGLMPIYKQMYGVDEAMKQTMRTIQAFGDAAGLTGAGIQGMNLALLGFRQIGTIGKLSMEELRQVTENLLIPMNIILDELGLTGNALDNLAKEGIEAKVAMEAIVRALEKNFAGGMEKMSESLLGLTATIKDTATLTVWHFGAGMAEPVKRVLFDIVGLTDETGGKFEEFQRKLEWAGEQVGLKFEQIYNEIKRFWNNLSADPEFQKLDFGDKLIYILNLALDKVDTWLSGEGSQRLQETFSKIGDIIANAWYKGMTNLGERTIQELKEGDIKGALVPAAIMWMMGGGALAKGIWGLGKGLFGAGKWALGKLGLGSAGATAAGVVAETAATAGGVGTAIGRARSWLGRIGLPIAAGLEAINIARAEDKKAAAILGTGRITGMIAGGKAGAVAGGAVGGLFGGIGMAPGAVIGGILGGIGGLFGGEMIARRINEWINKVDFEILKKKASDAWTWIQETINFANLAYGVGYLLGYLESTIFSGEWWQGHWQSVKDWTSEKWAGMVEIWENTKESLSSTLFSSEWWRGHWQSVKDWTSEKWDEMKTVWETTKEAISSTLFSKDWWAGQWESVKNWASSALSGITARWEELKASFAAGREAGQSVAATKYAIGGILTRPHLGLVAEAGPEAIIPLSARMRARAMDLWLETGRRLGVRPYAVGGFAGAMPAASGLGTSIPGASISVTNYIDVKVGGSNADPDSIAEAIAAKIESVFHNMTK